MASLTKERFASKTRQFSEREIYRSQGDFSEGMFDDSTLVPEKGVAYLENFINRMLELVGRSGSKVWGSALYNLPSLRTGYSTTSTVSGTTRTITATVGAAFVAADVGRWYVHDDGTHEIILSRTSDTIITTYSAVTTAKTSTAGWVRNPVNGLFYHKSRRQFVLHIGTALYVTSSVTGDWTLAYDVSGFALADDYSRFDEWQNWVFIGCNNKVYKCNLSSTPYYYHWINSPVPSVRLTDQALGVATTTPNKVLTPYCRRHVYGMSLISGSGKRDRTTTGSSIQHETGLTKFDTTTRKDYAESWTEKRVGDGTTTYGKITGGTVQAAYLSPSAWNTISDARGNVTYNTVEKEWSCDLRGILGLDEVAERIQQAMRNAFGEACNIIVKYGMDTDVGKFIFYCGNEGDTLTALERPTSGTGTAITDDTSTNYCNLDSPGESSPKYADGALNYTDIGNLTIPLSTTPIRHYTHYSIFSTLDIGKNGLDPISGKSNSEDLYIWNADVQVCNVLLVSVAGSSINNLLTATQGLFYREDEGSQITLYNGTTTTRRPISYLCDVNGVEVYTATSAYAYSLVQPDVTLDARPAAIGDEQAASTIRPMRGSQSAYTVTLTIGTVTSADIGKTLYWSDLTTSVISAVASGTQFTVLDSTTRTALACALDPVSRRYGDTVRDETLKTRIAYYTANMRGFEEVPSGDDIAIFPDMMYLADRGDTTVYYSPMLTYHEYQAGYYYPAKQYTTIKDKFVAFFKCKDSLAVVGANSTEVIDTNSYTLDQIESIGVSIKRIVGQTIADYNIGIPHFSAASPLKSGYYIAVTSEPAVRIWDGQAWSQENLAEDRIMGTLKSADKVFTIGYDSQNGVTLWIKTIAARLNRCFRYGFNKEQGVGWQEVTGSAILIPEIGIAPMSIYDTNSIERIVVMDAIYGRLYETGTRNLTYSSGALYRIRKDKEGLSYTITGITLSGTNVVSVACSGGHGFANGDVVEFRAVGGTDELNNTTFTITKTSDTAFTLNGTSSANFTAWTSGGECFLAGTDIQPSVRFGDDRGTFERYWLELLSTAIMVRPFDINAYDDNGYDANGYPDSLEATLYFYKSGALTATHSLLDVTMPKHEILSDRQIRDNRIATKITFNKGEIKVIGRLQYYKATDAPADPDSRATSEGTWQLEAATNLSVWVTRGSNLLLDRANGTTLAGAGTATAGPDGKSNSALAITTAVALANSAIAAGTFIIWYTGTVPTIDGISLTTYKTYGSWTMAYATGAIGASRTIATGIIFDCRVYSDTKDSDLYEYIYQSVSADAGRNVLPTY